VEPVPPGPEKGSTEGQGTVVKFSRGFAAWTRRDSATWTRRGLLAVVLLGAAIIPGRASSQTAAHCGGSRCIGSGSVLWSTRLTGAWVAEPGVTGTVPADGEAYAASAGRLAVLGAGTTVTGYDARTGHLSWRSALTGLSPGAAIISVRAWPAIIAVGVSAPAGQSGESRVEVILSAVTGRQIRSFPAAYYGGAVWASRTSTVIVGRHGVRGYANSTGRLLWQRGTGTAAQTWTVSGLDLYMAETAGGYLVSGPVTAIRQINLATGAEHVTHLGGRFAGTLSAVVDGVVLLTGGSELRGYSIRTGELRWQRSAAALELVDPGKSIAYIAAGNSLFALRLSTGDLLGRPAQSVAAGLYAIRNGVALGLDQGALGVAWGYDMTTRRVVWTSAALPWPHFFADSSGLGGSAGQDSAVTLLATCAAEGGGVPAVCQRPELAAIRY
jgi:outer membrane protein assembly factor BamB